MASDWLEGLDVTDPMVIAEILEQQEEFESLEMLGGLEAYAEPLLSDVDEEQEDWEGTTNE